MWTKNKSAVNFTGQTLKKTVRRSTANAQFTIVCIQGENRNKSSKIKHVVLLLRQLGHLQPDRLHQCRGGEAAQGHAVHVLHGVRKPFPGYRAWGSGWPLKCLVILQGQPGRAPLWVARMRKSLYIPGKGNLEDAKSVLKRLHYISTQENDGIHQIQQF